MTQIEEIGQGGFGIVHKVEDKDGKLFARKTFAINQPKPLSKTLEENVRKRFIQEAIRQEGISHPNIIPILAKDLDANPPYFIMPLAIGTLENELTLDHTLEGNFLKAILDIIAGLEEMHSLRYYHRDLKPANVLRFINERGEDYYAIGDFGLMAVRQTQVSSITQTGMRLSPDYYTAPEVVSDLKKATAQSDIFSIGCILHDCLVGVGQERVPCAEIKNNSQFGAILRKCTMADPARRFKSVAALRDAILSIGDFEIERKIDKNSQAENFLALLKGDVDDISIENWESMIAFLENNPTPYIKHILLMNFNISVITKLIETDEYMASRMGIIYANWIKDSSFNFAACDGLANRLEAFIDACDIDVKTECLLALLYLGTTHNRWYVEGKFARHAASSMDDTLAKRFAIECRVEEGDFCRAIRHLCQSINISLDHLHPILRATYNDVCKC